MFYNDEGEILLPPPPPMWLAFVTCKVFGMRVEVLSFPTPVLCDTLGISFKLCRWMSE